MFLKNLNKKEKYGIIASVLVVSAALLYNFIVEPFITRWRGLSGELDAKIRTLKKDTGILDRYKQIESEHKKYASYLKSSKTDEESIAETLDYIEKASKAADCRIVNVRPIGLKRYPSHKEIIVDVSAESDIAHFSRFLFDIENAKDILLRVRRFTISSRSSQDNQLKGSFFISKIVLN